jgi:hypothetical protein
VHAARILFFDRAQQCNESLADAAAAGGSAAAANHHHRSDHLCSEEDADHDADRKVTLDGARKDDLRVAGDADDSEKTDGEEEAGEAFHRRSRVCTEIAARGFIARIERVSPADR